MATFLKLRAASNFRQVFINFDLVAFFEGAEGRTDIWGPGPEATADHLQVKEPPEQIMLMLAAVGEHDAT